MSNAFGVLNDSLLSTGHLKMSSFSTPWKSEFRALSQVSLARHPVQLAAPSTKDFVILALTLRATYCFKRLECVFKGHSAHQVSTSQIVSMINANHVLRDAWNVSHTQASVLNARMVIY